MLLEIQICLKILELEKVFHLSAKVEDMHILLYSKQPIPRYLSSRTSHTSNYSYKGLKFSNILFIYFFKRSRPLLSHFTNNAGLVGCFLVIKDTKSHILVQLLLKFSNILNVHWYNGQIVIQLYSYVMEYYTSVKMNQLQIHADISDLDAKKD